MLPFCRVVLHAQKPLSDTHPRELKTIGDHIRKRRLDLKLRQEEVAGLFGVSREAVSDWEAGQTSPRVSIMPKVIGFLGYAPFDDPTRMSDGDRIRTARKLLGLTRERAAEHLGVTATSISLWENGRIAPAKRNRRMLDALVASASHVGETAEAPGR